MGNMRVSRDAGTVAAAREAKQCSPLAKTAKKAGSSASRGEDAPKPERLSRVLVTRLHNFPDREWFLPGGHFFMVPPGEVASPFLSTAPAVPAPCMLASFDEGLELPVVVPVTPLFTQALPVVVLCSYRRRLSPLKPVRRPARYAGEPHPSPAMFSV